MFRTPCSRVGLRQQNKRDYERKGLIDGADESAMRAYRERVVDAF